MQPSARFGYIKNSGLYRPEFFEHYSFLIFILRAVSVSTSMMMYKQPAAVVQFFYKTFS